MRCQTECSIDLVLGSAAEYRRGIRHGLAAAFWILAHEHMLLLNVEFDGSEEARRLVEFRLILGELTKLGLVWLAAYLLLVHYKVVSCLGRLLNIQNSLNLILAIVVDLLYFNLAALVLHLILNCIIMFLFDR